VQGVEGDDGALRHAEFGEQRLRRRDLAGLVGGVGVGGAGKGSDCLAGGKPAEGSTRAVSVANAPSTWAAARSWKWSKLPRSVLPSSARLPRPGVARAAWSRAARRRNAASTAAGSSPLRMWRIAVWAGARFQARPKAAFSLRRWTAVRVAMPR
jgi:hypothetical protein